jgi:hypothetical protein
MKSSYSIFIALIFSLPLFSMEGEAPALPSTSIVYPFSPSIRTLPPILTLSVINNETDVSWNVKRLGKNITIEPQSKKNVNIPFILKNRLHERFETFLHDIYQAAPIGLATTDSQEEIAINLNWVNLMDAGISTAEMEVARDEKRRGKLYCAFKVDQKKGEHTTASIIRHFLPQPMHSINIGKFALTIAEAPKLTLSEQQIVSYKMLKSLFKETDKDEFDEIESAH